jgi:TPR repeat protein
MPGWTHSVLAEEAKSNSTASKSASEQVDIEDIDSEYISDFELVDVPEDPPPDPELVKVIQDEEYTNGRMAFLFGQYEAAYKIWLPLAENGYAKAQATIAWMYHTGKGVKKDLVVAFDWYEKAAKQNHPIAQNNVGVFYEQGLSVGKSATNAAKWYREAAEWGYPYAQYNLGTLYLEGRGVKRDEKEAQFWLQIAALQGVEQAIAALQKMSPESHKKISTGTKTISVKKSPHTTPHGSSNYKDIYNRIKTTNPDPGGFDYGGSLSPTTSSPSSKNKSIEKAAPKSKSTPTRNTQDKTVTAKELLPGQKFDKWFADAQAAQAHLKKLDNEKSTNSHSLKVFNDEWVREQKPTNYTLQIARSDQLDWLLNVAKKQPMLKDTAYYTTVVDGKKWFYLIYGNFTNRESANEEIQKLPKALKKWSPWIRQFSDLQSNMAVK